MKTMITDGPITYTRMNQPPPPPGCHHRIQKYLGKFWVERYFPAHTIEVENVFWWGTTTHQVPGEWKALTAEGYACYAGRYIPGIGYRPGVEHKTFPTKEDAIAFVKELEEGTTTFQKVPQSECKCKERTVPTIDPERELVWCEEPRKVPEGPPTDIIREGNDRPEKTGGGGGNS